jgi:prefoldin subunit 4
MASVKNLPVSWDDQHNINRYSYIIYRTNKMARALEQAKTTAGNQKEALEELSVLELEDEGDTRVAVLAGNAFFHLPIDQARFQAELVGEKAENEAEALQSELDTQKAELVKLKKQLEGKFGDSIRLE